MSSSVRVEVRLQRGDRLYAPGEAVRGAAALTCGARGGAAHDGVRLVATGVARAAAKEGTGGGFFGGGGSASEKASRSVTLFRYEALLVPPGRLAEGETSAPFEFTLGREDDARLVDSYHGAAMSVQYVISAEAQTKGFGRSPAHEVEFVLERPPGAADAQRAEAFAAKQGSGGGGGGGEAGQAAAAYPVEFALSESTHGGASLGSALRSRGFEVVCRLDSSVARANSGLSGWVNIKRASAPVRAVWLQLVRVERPPGAPAGAGGEASEVMRTQLADGDVCHGMRLPVHVQLPRLFCCPSVPESLNVGFSLGFEANLMVSFEAEGGAQEGPTVMQNVKLLIVPRVPPSRRGGGA